jgi:hypothetical protein
MTSDPDQSAPFDAPAVDRQASILMKEGIRLMESGDAHAIAGALDCFDRALDLRRRLPIDAVPLFRYGLAACWLNRADALVRIGDDDRLSAALDSYDEGIRVLRGLRLGDDARFPRRLAIAFQNRGLALQRRAATSGESIAAFTDAIAVLESDAASAIVDRQYLLGVTWVNLASARASAIAIDGDANGDVPARDAALRAMALVGDLETLDASAAAIGLQARHVLCRTVAGRLSQTATNGETMPDAVHAATDAVDEGLHLVRHWERQGVDRFRPFACDFLRFGARVYAHYQPHFLEEFVRENMDPAQSSDGYVESLEMRAAVEEALRLRSA